MNKVDAVLLSLFLASLFVNVWLLDRQGEDCDYGSQCISDHDLIEYVDGCWRGTSCALGCVNGTCGGGWDG